RGELGCYVAVDPLSDGSLRVRMVERRVAPDRVVTDILAERVFDAAEPGAVAGSAEVVAELREWAGRRNDDRGAAEQERAGRREDADAELAARRREAAELARILGGA
ncbi:MAG: DUF3824 domain-containing protein, partial [Solirubrobacterales bacterium]|nr:DUF3824 domain-containing protein [Solirubrobacterales bacterium]